MSDNYREIARQAALKHGLIPDVFERQIEAESGFNPKAVSPSGARGIAQIMPTTAKGWGVNPDNPTAALNAAAKNMAGYIKTYLGGKAPSTVKDPAKLRVAYEKGLRAYNAGPGAVEASKQYAETNRYVQKIIDPNKFSFTEALKGQEKVDVPTTGPDVAARGGRTFIIFGDEDVIPSSSDFLEDYAQKLIAGEKTKVSPGLDVTGMLAKAMFQAPNYLEG
jgi:Transglycosylase SLT domain